MVVLVASILIFLLIRAVPGDPAHAYAGSLELAGAALLLGIAFGSVTGTLAALKRGTWGDYAIGTWNSIALGAAPFWFGILLVLVFSVKLRVLPAGGRVNPADAFGAGLESLILPATALSIRLQGIISRFARASLLDVLSDDYILAARAKGIAPAILLLRHAWRNAVIPLITVIAFETGALITGVVIIEAVFAWPGIGTLVLTSISARDYSVVQGVLLLMVSAYIGLNLLADIAQFLVDPRLRAGLQR